MLNRIMAAIQDGTTWVLESPFVLVISLGFVTPAALLAASSDPTQTPASTLRAMWIVAIACTALAACIAENRGQSWVTALVCSGIAVEMIVCHLKMNVGGLHATWLLGLMLILSGVSGLMDWSRSTPREEHRRETAVVLSLGAAIPAVVYHDDWALAALGIALTFVWLVWYANIWRNAPEYQAVRSM